VPATHLRQGGVDVGNREQGEGAQGIVAGVVGQRDGLAVETYQLEATGDALIRFCAIRKAVAEGSTAKTRSTPDG
jgi:hypothetical protein